MEIGFMKLRLFKKIVDEASAHLPVTLVPFFRGEPLLHGDFIKMVSYAKDRGLSPIQIATNAFLLNEEAAIKILDLHIDFISFSVDALNPAAYKKMRNSPDYKIVLKNILAFIKLKARKKNSNTQIQVSAVRTPENSNYMGDFVKFWIDKVDRVRIYRAHSINGNLGKINYNVNIRRKPCRKVFTDMVIYWDGKVAICNHDWQRGFFIGDVGKENISKIWVSKRYEQIRERHLLNHLKDFAPCNYCSHWPVYYQKKHFIGELYEKK
jgi:radical SAM protein with 4Fe4S-binding SPASM domain